MAQAKEHGLRLITNDIKHNNIGNVLLFYGKEQYLIDWSLEKLAAKYINKGMELLDYIKLDSDKLTLGQIIENCDTFSMFSDRRIVVIPGFTLIEGKSHKNFSEADEEALVEYLKTASMETLLIFTTVKPDMRKKLYKCIESLDGAYCFDTLDMKDLKSFIGKILTQNKKKCSPAVIEALIQSGGYYNKDSDYTLYNLVNDLKKIIAHSSGEEVLLTDVLSTLSGDLETNTFGMIDAVSKKRKDEAYRLLHNLLTSEENAFRILAVLVSQFELLLEVKELKEEGCSMVNTAQRLSVHEFRVKKIWGLCESYTIEGLKRALSCAYNVDKNIKTGLLSDSMALEMFIAEI